MKNGAVLIFFILLVAQIFASAEEISVVDVRRNITLSDDEPIYKDFYLNAGEGAGLKKNLVVNVKRKISVKDHAAKPVGDFETVVGQVRIIHAGNRVAVAREYKLQSRDEDPMLEQVGIMTGDRLDLAGSFIDNSKPVVPRRKTADADADSNEKKTALLQIDVIQDVKNPIKPESAPEKNREPATQPPAAPVTTPEI